jgi:methylenetetrahydrofolate dehydrogenase (NADP+)/methenyltetrahydrofolate cyclohydrolase
MIIDGRKIATKNLKNLKKRVEKLKSEGLTPKLYIILLSNDPVSTSYVKQKLLRADETGIQIVLDNENPTITTDKLTEKIKKLNNDSSINGIIIQRPMSKQLSEEIIANAVSPKKDIDGFNYISEFEVPVSMAIFKILRNIHPNNFERWLSVQKIMVVGNGLTAGKPIIKSFRKLGIKTQSINSKTENKNKLLKTSDIIISAVGKADVIKVSEIKKGAILIGVGLHKEDDGKFHGDFDEEKIEKIASFYSPTPGGVGPVNVACLLENLVTAAENCINQ